MGYIQTQFSHELTKKIKLYALKNDFDKLQEALVDIVAKFFEQSEDDIGIQ